MTTLVEGDELLTVTVTGALVAERPLLSVATLWMV